MTTPAQHRGTALVTGGGTGIGRACSLALATRGHPVAVVYSRSADDAESAVGEIRAAGGRAVAVQADVTDEVFDRLLRINTKAAWYVARAAAPDLRAAREAGDDAVVVNIGSVAAIAGQGSSLPYVVSKALSGLTRALARALAPVRVNEVAPGLVPTRWWAGDEERGRRLAANAIVGRETTPEDVAAAVVGLVARGQTL